MKNTRNSLSNIKLLFDLFILSNTQIIIFLNKIGIFETRQFITHFIIVNSFWIISHLVFGKKCFYLLDCFLCRFNILNKKFLVYFFLYSIVTLLFFHKFISIQYFLISSAIFYSLLLFAHFIFYRYLRLRRESGINIRRAVILTNSKAADMVRQIIHCNPILGYKFIGFVVINNPEDKSDVIGSIRNLRLLIRNHKIQAIFSLNIKNDKLNNTLINVCDRNGIKLCLFNKNQQFHDLQNKRKTSEGIELIKIREVPFDNILKLILKRLFDILFSLCVIVFVFTWLFPIAAFIIKLSSKGPVFFTQKRTGLHNNTFTCYKFRTMVVNEFSDIKQATHNDDRITRIGNFMRNTNIDELPQFFNVLMGQMSIVGPRPHMLKHTDIYSHLVENYLIRHYVKPGITGWAQVNGYRGETRELWKMQKRIEYDLFYLKNWTFLLDLKIIVNTIIKYKPQPVLMPSDHLLVPQGHRLDHPLLPSDNLLVLSDNQLVP